MDWLLLLKTSPKIAAAVVAAIGTITVWKLTKQGRKFMEDKIIYQGDFGGPHGKVTIELKGGNVQASMAYDSAELGASASFQIKSKAGLEFVKTLIPGKIDDAIISVIEMALGV